MNEQSHGRKTATGKPAGGKNLRTALVLLSIAAMFFAGIIVNRWLFAH